MTVRLLSQNISQCTTMNVKLFSWTSANVQRIAILKHGKYRWDAIETYRFMQTVMHNHSSVRNCTTKWQPIHSNAQTNWNAISSASQNWPQVTLYKRKGLAHTHTHASTKHKHWSKTNNIDAYTKHSQVPMQAPNVLRQWPHEAKNSVRPTKKSDSNNCS